MRIILKDTFVTRLGDQLDYIAQSNPANARKFKDDLFKQLKTISPNPYKYRKSIWFDDPNIRDLIFKGYTIIFRIKANTIEVFGFVKYQYTAI